MPSKRVLSCTLACVLVLATVWATAKPSPSAPLPPNRDTLVIALTSDLVHEDPQTDYNNVDQSVYQAVFDPLVRRNDGMKLEGVLAESWNMVSSTEFVFKIRAGVKFHNGEILTAETIKENFDRILDPSKQRLPFVRANVKAAEVMDSRTVKLIATHPNPLFINSLTQIYIVPTIHIRKVGEEAFIRAPVGSGPYKFVERVKDNRIVLIRNDEYWGSKPQIKNITFRIIREASTRLSALRSGEVQLISKVAPDQADEIAKLPGITVKSVPTPRTPYVSMFPDSPGENAKILNDKRVRQALNYALDVPSIIRNVLAGRATRTATLLTPEFFGYNPNVAPYPYDPVKAKALLAEAGYPDGFTIDFQTATGGTIVKPAELSEAIVGQLERIGVRARLQKLEFTTMFRMRNERKIAPLYMWSWFGENFDADDKFYGHLSPESQYALFVIPSLVAGIRQGRSVLDRAARQRIYFDLQEKLKDEAPFVFLHAQHEVYAGSSNLVFTPRADELMNVAQFKLQWK